MDYGDTSIPAVVDRLTRATSPSRILDVLVWLHVGVDYPERRHISSPISPKSLVNGLTMKQGIARGFTDIASAFSVPQVTSNIGATYELADRWFPVCQIDLRTGGGVALHRAILSDHSIGQVMGLSRLSGAAAFCAALLSAFSQQNALCPIDLQTRQSMEN